MKNMKFVTAISVLCALCFVGVALADTWITVTPAPVKWNKMATRDSSYISLDGTPIATNTGEGPADTTAWISLGKPLPYPVADSSFILRGVWRCTSCTSADTVKITEQYTFDGGTTVLSKDYVSAPADNKVFNIIGGNSAPKWMQSSGSWNDPVTGASHVRYIVSCFDKQRIDKGYPAVWIYPIFMRQQP